MCFGPACASDNSPMTVVRRAIRRVLVVAAVVAMLLTGSVCAQGSALQLIIQFSEARMDPARPEFVASLSQELGVALRYVRPMSGDAHVFGIMGSLDTAQLDGVIRRLSARSDVVYVEPDRLMQAQGVR